MAMAAKAEAETAAVLLAALAAAVVPVAVWTSCSPARGNQVTLHLTHHSNLVGGTPLPPFTGVVCTDVAHRCDVYRTDKSYWYIRIRGRLQQTFCKNGVDCLHSGLGLLPPCTAVPPPTAYYCTSTQVFLPLLPLLALHSSVLRAERGLGQLRPWLLPGSYYTHYSIICFLLPA